MLVDYTVNEEQRWRELSMQMAQKNTTGSSAISSAAIDLTRNRSLECKWGAGDVRHERDAAQSWLRWNPKPTFYIVNKHLKSLPEVHEFIPCARLHK